MNVFVQTESGEWFIKIANEYDIRCWNETFARKFYEQAATNLMEGKEYGNDTLSHSPYFDATELSEMVYIKAGYNTERALVELYRLRKEVLETFKKEVEQGKIILVNQKLGYRIVEEECPFIQTITGNVFPKRTQV